MKKVIFVLSIVALFACGTLFLKSQSAPAKMIDVKTQVESLEKGYGAGLVESFYSLDELRPYAIIQMDKTIDMYENDWIAPSDVYKKLTPKERDLIKTKLIGFISSKPVEEREHLLTKIKSWCIADLQFEFIKSNYNQSEQTMLGIMKNLAGTSEVFETISKSGPCDLAKLSENEKNEAYNKVLNKIAEMKLNDQFKYYSAVFTNLSTLAEKN